MAVAIETADFPTPPGPDQEDRTSEERIENLETALRNLTSALGNYSYIPNQYAETILGDLDDIPDGTTFARVKVGNIDITDGTIIVSSGDTLDSRFDVSGDLATDAFTTTITNSSITVSSNGTINNAGGGQVTISGLGYSGDLNADNTTTVIGAGFITTGSITLNANGGHIKGGQTAYDTGTGFFLGDETGFKFSIGNAGTESFTWDGSSISITCTDGKIGSSSNFFDITNGVLTISSGTFDTTIIANLGIIGDRIIIGGVGGAFFAQDTEGSNTAFVAILSENTPTGITLSDSTTTYTIKGFTLTSCSITASQIDSGTMDGARVSGGTFGAVDGSALTNLPAPINVPVFLSIEGTALRAKATGSVETLFSLSAGDVVLAVSIQVTVIGGTSRLRMGVTSGVTGASADVAGLVTYGSTGSGTLFRHGMANGAARLGDWVGVRSDGAGNITFESELSLTATAFEGTAWVLVMRESSKS